MGFVDWIDRQGIKIKESIDRQKELRAIEQNAYEHEKEIVKAEKFETDKDIARQRGLDKAHNTGGGFGSRIDRAAKRMEEMQKTTSDKKSSNSNISMINFGPK